MSDAKVALGCRLFFETRLSVTQAYSCASCHHPELAFTDGRALAVGAKGDSMHRGAMTLTNVAYNPAFTWASDSVVTLERQMEQPLFNEHPLEMGLKRDDRALLEWLGQQENYAAAFRQSFPQEAEPITIPNVVKAIATFERTLISGRSAFDRYVYDDDRAAFSEGARRGMRLFYSDRSGCAHCHFGLNFSGPIVHRGKPEQRALFANNGTAVKGDEGLSVETKRRAGSRPLQSADVAQHRADRAVHARRAIRDAGACDRALRRGRQARGLDRRCRFADPPAGFERGGEARSRGVPEKPDGPAVRRPSRLRLMSLSG